MGYSPWGRKELGMAEWLYFHFQWILISLKHFIVFAAAAKLLQLCPTLCDPIDSSPPDSPVPGILQARTLEGLAIFFSNAWKWKVKVKSLSSVRLFPNKWNFLNIHDLKGPPFYTETKEIFDSAWIVTGTIRTY